MLYNKNIIPQTLEEFYNSGWAAFTKYKISKYNLKDINNSVDDVFHDMVCQMAEYNYIEEYDPTSRPFEVYLSVFIFNFMSKRYRKEYKSKNGQKIINAASLEEVMPDNLPETGERGVCYLEKIPDTDAAFEDYTDLLISVRSDLEQFKATSSVEHNGVHYDRDPQTVLDLLLEGHTVVEISEILETSKQFIYLLINKIKNCSSLKEYKPAPRRRRS